MFRNLGIFVLRSVSQLSQFMLQIVSDLGVLRVDPGGDPESVEHLVEFALVFIYHGAQEIPLGG